MVLETHVRRSQMWRMTVVEFAHRNPRQLQLDKQTRLVRPRLLSVFSCLCQYAPLASTYVDGSLPSLYVLLLDFHHQVQMTSSSAFVSVTAMFFTILWRCIFPSHTIFEISIHLLQDDWCEEWLSLVPFVHENKHCASHIRSTLTIVPMLKFRCRYPD